MTALISKVRESTTFDRVCRAPLYKAEDGKIREPKDFETCEITNTTTRYPEYSVLSMLEENGRVFTDIAGVRVKMYVFTHDKSFVDEVTVLGESSAFFFIQIDDVQYKIKKTNVFFAIE